MKNNEINEKPALSKIAVMPSVLLSEETDKNLRNMYERVDWHLKQLLELS